MIRIFVDCDDTLMYVTTVNGTGVTRHFNEELVESLIQVRDFHPDAFLVCWSSGGEKYAKETVVLAGIEHLFDLFACKDKMAFPLAVKGSIVIDAMAESVKIRGIDKIWLPNDFGWKAEIDALNSSNG